MTNNAIGGRSARSYTDEGRFDTLISQAAKGDYVVIEFGHNDNRSLEDNPTTGDCPGASLTATCDV